MRRNLQLVATDGTKHRIGTPDSQQRLIEAVDARVVAGASSVQQHPGVQAP